MRSIRSTQRMESRIHRHDFPRRVYHIRSTPSRHIRRLSRTFSAQILGQVEEREARSQVVGGLKSGGGRRRWEARWSVTESLADALREFAHAAIVTAVGSG